MLYCYKTDISEGIDVNKTSKSKECNISHYGFFINKDFNFQPKVCNRCNDLSMTSMILLF